MVDSAVTGLAAIALHRSAVPSEAALSSNHCHQVVAHLPATAAAQFDPMAFHHSAAIRRRLEFPGNPLG
jgi:hypothetical protein